MIKLRLFTKNVIAILCICLPLSGCVASALAVGATVGGAVVYDKRSFKVINQDRRAKQSAQNLIDHSKALRGRSHISVATFNHIMLLVGQAQTRELRDTAEKLVSNVKNVQRIYNEITITGASSLLQRTNDSWLTTKIKAAMLTAGRLHSTQIKVVTESGTVYLMGLVSHQQAKLATNVARRVSGVRKVVKVFQYT